MTTKEKIYVISRVSKYGTSVVHAVDNKEDAEIAKRDLEEKGELIVHRYQATL